MSEPRASPNAQGLTQTSTLHNVFSKQSSVEEKEDEHCRSRAASGAGFRHRVRRRQGRHLRDRASSPSRPTAQSSSAPARPWSSRPPRGGTEAREGADFFPLTIDVEERMYAAGKIPGGFFKREGRPTERAILTARMIDRPIRPLWPKGYRNEVQCIATVLSADMVTPHDILAINGVSAALMVSPMPFLGPIGAVRIGLIDGELVVDPTLAGGAAGERARPDRRRHEGRPDDGRGRRRPGARGEAARGARARAPRDREDLRGAGGAPGAGRQGQVARPGRHRGAARSKYGDEIWQRIQERGLHRGRRDRRGDPRARVRRRSR